MAHISGSELDFLRLLERTKRLTKENLSQNVWKVNAATKILNNLISQMQNESTINDILIEYRREVDQLKQLVDAENKHNIEESLKAVEKIPRLFPDIQVKLKEEERSEQSPYYQKESAAGLRVVQRSIYRSDLRKQLLNSKKVKADDEDYSFMKNEKIEENLATDLLSMTRSLKTVMSAANDVIKEDNQKLVRMQNQIDKNKISLETESNRLERHAYKCGFECIRLVIIIVVFWVFVMMVLFMKFSKKIVQQ